jgi:hypothetical protein
MRQAPERPAQPAGRLTPPGLLVIGYFAQAMSPVGVCRSIHVSATPPAPVLGAAGRGEGPDAAAREGAGAAGDAGAAHPSFQNAARRRIIAPLVAGGASPGHDRSSYSIVF